MRFSSILPAALGGLILPLALSSASKVIEFAVKRAEIDSPASNFVRRSTPFVNELQWGRKGVHTYYTTVYIGLPPQKVDLIISTGSSDVWVIDTLADECVEAQCLTPCMYSKARDLQALRRFASMFVIYSFITSPIYS
jgi:hypothetical protein